MRDPFKKFRISISSRDTIEPEEIFFDSSKFKEFESAFDEQSKLEKPIHRTVFNVLEWLQIGVLVFLGVFSAFTVITKSEHYKLEALGNSSRVLPVFTKRGLIYSSSSAILADNQVYFDVVIHSPSINKSNEELLAIADAISRDLGVDKNFVYEKFIGAMTNKLNELALFKSLSENDIKKIEKDIVSLPFIEIRQTFKRNYPLGEYLAHVIGYTGEVSSFDVSSGNYYRGDRIGKTGIEAFYDNALRGSPGTMIKRVNSRGEVFSQEVRKEPVEGKDLILNIDLDVQEISFNILKSRIDKLGIKAGALIVLNPNDGRIISLASYPSFNSNLFEKGISEPDFQRLLSDPATPLFHRAIGGEYPSGSTIKPLIAAAALEEEIITPQFRILSTGVLRVPSIYDSSIIYEFKDWKAHGWTDMKKAIADSVNVYFYTIGGGYNQIDGLGITRIEKYLREFGWGQTLGVDLPGESQGLIPNPKWKKEFKKENWYIGDTYLTSIGQGNILATPLQIAASTMVFANGGILYAPQVVFEIQGEKLNPLVLNKDFILKENINAVREGMRQTVVSGSAKHLSSLSISAAGKTGSAEVSREKYHAWFTGFAPYEDPEIVITVLLEEGDSSGFAVETAKEVLEAWIKLKRESSTF